MGRAGMDYAAVLAYLRGVRRLRGAELEQVFAGIQAAEYAVLESEAAAAVK